MLRKNHKSLHLAEARRGEVGVQETGSGDGEDGPTLVGSWVLG